MTSRSSWTTMESKSKAILPIAASPCLPFYWREKMSPCAAHHVLRNEGEKRIKTIVILNFKEMEARRRRIGSIETITVDGYA